MTGLTMVEWSGTSIRDAGTLSSSTYLICESVGARDVVRSVLVSVVHHVGVRNGMLCFGTGVLWGRWRFVSSFARFLYRRLCRRWAR